MLLKIGLGSHALHTVSIGLLVYSLFSKMFKVRLKPYVIINILFLNNFDVVFAS